MTEIELFLKLLDNEATDNLLKAFNENVKLNNLEFKKIKLMKILRGAPSNRKKPKIKMNPFEFAIYQCVNESFKTYNAYELFQMFSEDVQELIPNYTKIANALFYHEKETKENLDKIIENYTNEETLFKNIVNFSSIEEVEEFLMKDEKCVLAIKDLLIGYILKNITEEEKLILDSGNLKNIMKEWTLVHYYNNFIELSKEFPIYLIQLEYLSLNKNKTEIENGIAMDMLFNYNNLNKNQYNQQKEEILNRLLEEIKSKANLLSQQNIQLIKDNKGYNNKFIKFEKEIAAKEDKIDNYEKRLVKEVNENKKLEDSLSEDKNLIEKLRINNKDTKEEIKILKNKNLEFMKKIEHMDSYFECSCSYADNEKTEKFIIITSMEVDICKIIYPEIIFININNLNGSKCEDKIPKNIEYIYIQRNGTSSSMINSIEKFAKRNNIKSKLIIKSNQRELIEEIVKIKNNTMGV